MVRLKHRWTTVQLVTAASDSQKLLRDITTNDIQKVKTAPRSAHDDWSSSLQALELAVLTFHGDFGLAEFLSCVCIPYWYPQSGVFVCKTSWDGFQVLRPAVVLMNEVAFVPVRPTVVHVSATLIQTRRFLIDFFHVFLRDQWNRKHFSAAQREKLVASVATHNQQVLLLT